MPRAPKPWPLANPPQPGEGLACTCQACGLPWDVHPSMAGFRLRCDCGEWVAVPAPVVTPPAESQELSTRRAEVRLPERYRDPAEPLKHEVPTQTPMAEGSLRHATLPTRRRWIDRAILELALVMFAFLGPQLLVLFLFSGQKQLYSLPIAELISAVLVVAICFSMPRYTLSGLRSTSSRYYLEALGVAALALLVVFPYSEGLTKWLELEDDGTMEAFGGLGLGWALLLIGVFPAIFEELAFRGLILPRIMALLGRHEGVIAAGTAFALAHGITLGLPFHFFLGIYLGYLRIRSGSLWPCMLTHFVYNSTIVWMEFR